MRDPADPVETATGPAPAGLVMVGGLGGPSDHDRAADDGDGRVDGARPDGSRPDGAAGLCSDGVCAL